MADDVVLPGVGWVYFAAPDTTPFDLGQFSETSIDSQDGWTRIGNTSRENLVALSKEGGEKTTVGSWENPNLRTTVSDTTYGLTVNALSMTRETLEYAFPGGTWDEDTGMFKTPLKAQSVNKAVMVVMKDDVNGFQAFYFPNGAVSMGDAPELSTESFIEIPLSVTGQNSSTFGTSFAWIPPKDLATEPGVSDVDGA